MTMFFFGFFFCWVWVWVWVWASVFLFLGVLVFFGKTGERKDGGGGVCMCGVYILGYIYIYVGGVEGVEGKAR